jgi:hypothetical protein
LPDSNLRRQGRGDRRGAYPTEEASMRAQQAINPTVLRDRILQLQTEHSELDRMIDKLAGSPDISDLELRRLKKRKLKVKDNIILLQLQLEPDTYV